MNLADRCLRFLTSAGPAAAAARAGLAPLSLLYRAGTILASRSARARRAPPLPLPVISIGQIHSGGVGKTPFAIALGEALAARGRKVGVVLRGYRGAESARGAIVARGDGEVLLGPAQAGDEAVETAQALSGGDHPASVAIGADRAAAARRLVEETRPDILLLDDAFQHAGIHRDLDVVLLPACAHPSRERLLPAGPLREPYEALARAGYLVVTGVPRAASGGVAGIPEEIARVLPDLPATTARTMPLAIRPIGGTVESVVPLGRPVLLVSGIASPERFEESVRAVGARIAGRLDYPDHHFYSEADIARITRRRAQDGADFVVTTEKDAIRLPKTLAFPCAVLTVRLEIDAPDWVDRILASAVRLRAR